MDIKMLDRKIRKILKQETDIPAVVENQAEETLRALLDNQPVKKKNSQRRTGMFFFYAKVAAAVMAIFIVAGTTVYAAAKWGVFDFLSFSGWEADEEVEQLQGETIVENAITASNTYVTYTIREAVCDSELIYMVIEAVPKDPDSYLLVPEYCMPEDSVSELGIDGVTEGTIGEYASDNGKEILYAGTGLFYGESLMSCTEDARGTKEGTLYFCLTGTNGTGETSLDVTCVGTAYQSGMPVAERCEFEITLWDKSNSSSTTYILQDAEAAAEAGIALEQIDITETELGMYATLVYRNIGGAAEDIHFMLADNKGNLLEHMPYYAGGGLEEVQGENGISYRCTFAYQKENLEEGISLIIRNSEENKDYPPIQLVEKE